MTSLVNFAKTNIGYFLGNPQTLAIVTKKKNGDLDTKLMLLDNQNGVQAKETAKMADNQTVVAVYSEKSNKMYYAMDSIETSIMSGVDIDGIIVFPDGMNKEQMYNGIITQYNAAKNDLK